MRIFKATKQLNSDKWKSVLCLFGYTNRNPATGRGRGRSVGQSVIFSVTVSP